MQLRDAIDNHPLLSKYMRCLTTADLIPGGVPRQPASASRCVPGCGMERPGGEDEFVARPVAASPSRSGLTGIDGDTFKRDQLMDKLRRSRSTRPPATPCCS